MDSRHSLCWKLYWVQPPEWIKTGDADLTEGFPGWSIPTCVWMSRVYSGVTEMRGAWRNASDSSTVNCDECSQILPVDRLARIESFFKAGLQEGGDCYFMGLVMLD